jgi:hypothetical protein
MEHSLNIRFDAEGFSQANRSVVLVKNVIQGWPPVAWIGFRPLLSNQVVWNSRYEVFASDEQFRPGVVLGMSARTSADLGNSYAYAQGGFSQPQPGSPNAITIVNQDSRRIILGLAQEAMVNDASQRAPQNAIDMMMQSNQQIVPSENVFVFAGHHASDGTVLNQVPGNALNVQLNSGSPSANLTYNSKTSTFQRA